MPSRKPLVLIGRVNLASTQHVKGVSMTSNYIKEGEDADASNASEYLSLIDTAARLSTYLLNRDAPPLPSSFPDSHYHRTTEVENVRQEAELLLKFMASKIPRSSSDLSETDESISSNSSTSVSSISPSLSFESRKHSHGPLKQSLKSQEWTSSTFESRKRSQRYTQEVFSLNCPVLSLTPSTSGDKIAFPIQSPASLLARSMVTCDTADIGITAEILATNALNSFIDAINWRARSWIKSLSKVLVLREKIENSKTEKKCSKNTSSTEQTEDDPDNNGKTKSIVTDEVKKSCEARVILAIAQALPCIAVHDIRTTFHVLEQHAQMSPSDEQDVSEISGASIEVPHKKIRRERVTTALSHSCTLSHALKVEFKCTVSTSNNRLDIVLQAPGAIHGIFVTKNGSIHLSKVDVTIDTAALAESMEKNSRLVVQTAAKQQILCPPRSEDDVDSVNSSTQITSLDSQGSHDDWSDTEEEEKSLTWYHSPNQHNHYERNAQSSINRITPETSDNLISFPSSVLVTPMNHESNSNSSSDSEMPPPPPRLPDEFPMPTVEKKVSFKINPRRVSPSLTSVTVDNDVDIQSLEDVFNSPKGTKPIITSTVFDSIDSQTNVVSPHPSNNVNICANTKIAELNCPSLPILAEVACAASIV